MRTGRKIQKSRLGTNLRPRNSYAIQEALGRFFNPRYFKISTLTIK